VLHEHGWVFFDLRMPNVLVKTEHGAWEVRLIDFELCGRVGSPRVGKCLNPRLSWPAGIPMLSKEGDNMMLAQLWTNIPKDANIPKDTTDDSTDMTDDSS